MEGDHWFFVSAAVEFEQIHEDCGKLSILLRSFKLFHLHCERVIVRDWGPIIVDKYHFSFGFTHFFQMFEILDESAVDLPAGISVKPALNASLRIDRVENKISVLFVARCINPDIKDLGNCIQKLIDQRSFLDIHRSSFILSYFKSNTSTVM